MRETTPRIRMFAGPNGSGKSTLKDHVCDTYLTPEQFGIYINADEIEKEIKKTNTLNLNDFQIDSVSSSEFYEFIRSSTLLEKFKLTEIALKIKVDGTVLHFDDIDANSYYAAVCADFIRQKLLSIGRSFSFETVMSFPDKIELLHNAQELGYRTYLYFVAVDDPEISISRVRERVLKGGHPVDEDKIVSRYYKSLDNLFDAVEVSNRAYMFDNSNVEHSWFCEITDCEKLEWKGESYPAWFKDAFIDKIN